MPQVPLTRTSHLLPFANLLREMGTPVERLLEKAKLPSQCLDDPKMLVPCDCGWQFREMAARSSGLPNIALDATRGLEIADLGEFGQALFRAPTLYKLLTEFRRLAHTQTSNLIIELRQLDTGDVSFCHRFLMGPESAEWHSNLYVLQWMFKLVRLVDPNWSPREIWISSRATTDRRKAIEQLGAAAASFGCPCTGFLVPASMLALPLKRNIEPEESQDVEEEKFWSTAPARTYSETLQQVIRSYAHDRWLSIDEAGEVVGTSVRTMQRRLAKEKVTYSAVVDKARLAIAVSLLETADAKLSDIAAKLGYSTPANFSRAFSRWTDVSPSEFRRRRKTT
jgi:AraC-like DNA-binding protein